MYTRRPYRRQTTCAVAALLACILAWPVGTPADAADLGVAPIYRPPAPLINWAGSYIGVGGGAAWGTANVHNDFTGDQTGAFDLRGGILGTTSGFNFQNENLVYGFEGNTSRRANAVDLPPNAAFSNQVQEPWFSTYRGRLGYTQNNWMLYATGGAALAGVDNGAIGPAGQIAERHLYWGWTVGGGVEMRLTPDWSAKVEYLYVGLQDKSYFNPAPVPFQSNQHLNPDDHILRVGVNYKLPWSILDSYFKR